MEDGKEILQYFEYDHLPLVLREASKPFYILAKGILEDFPANRERIKALDFLLSAKDAGVRSFVSKERHRLVNWPKFDSPSCSFSAKQFSQLSEEAKNICYKIAYEHGPEHANQKVLLMISEAIGRPNDRGL